MIDGKSVLAIIPARGGSKGVPRKNIRDLGGKPLIAWSIEAARKSQFIDRVILSSEDEEIISVAKQWGCDVPFIRPKELSADHTPGIEPVLHAIRQLPEYDYIVLLQPTSPMRRAEDIDGCISQCLSSGAGACVSVTEVDKSPYWMYFLDEEGRMMPIIKTERRYNQRQELPKVYALNGAIYVAQSGWLKENKTFVTKQTVAYYMTTDKSIDIDEETDLIYLKALLAEGYYEKL